MSAIEFSITVAEFLLSNLLSFTVGVLFCMGLFLESRRRD